MTTKRQQQNKQQRQGHQQRRRRQGRRRQGDAKTDPLTAKAEARACTRPNLSRKGKKVQKTWAIPGPTDAPCGSAANRVQARLWFRVRQLPRGYAPHAGGRAEHQPGFFKHQEKRKTAAAEAAAATAPKRGTETEPPQTTGRNPRGRPRTRTRAHRPSRIPQRSRPFPRYLFAAEH